MRVAIDMVKDGGANACVSAGNTGALMAVSRYVLKTMAGVDRPAICSILPNEQGKPTYMLDLGANVDCEPHHLHQFAIMGSVLCSAMEGVKKPSIGLLNVGTEEIKGNEVVKATAALLRADHERGALNFHGNVEGSDIFKGTTDVVVCDGFVGNVTLKTMEGLAHFFKSAFKENLLSMLGGLLAYGSLKKLNPKSYNGAGLLGLKGLVFKSHGGADAYSFEWAIRRAFDAAKNNVQEQLSAMIAELMPKASVPEVPGSTIKQS
jgi:glycerol-3-phosphate acyltransferase PlsX